MSVTTYDVTITYLEQRARPALRPPPPPPGMKTAILRAEKPPVHFYRYLYDVVGRPYKWVSRRAMSDAELASIIHRDSTMIDVLYVNGAPAGFAEVDASKKDYEIKFFGLTPEYTGQQLGRYFLSHVVLNAWDHGAVRLLLETCTLDHPAALPLYQKMGFTVYDQKPGAVAWAESAA